MNLAARFVVSDTSAGGEFGGYTGLDDPTMCLLWIDDIPNDDPMSQAPPNLDIMSCDFQVLESIPEILQ